jgi:hypothetical protein
MAEFLVLDLNTFALPNIERFAFAELASSHVQIQMLACFVPQSTGCAARTNMRC